VKSVTAPDDAKEVMSALRLGWYLAEARGRNKPNGPLGSSARMPDHVDHALPLKTERGQTELRIEAQSVMAALAKDLNVDEADGGGSFGATITDQATLLAHVRAPAAAKALNQAITALADQANQANQADQADPGPPPPNPAERAVALLRHALDDQQHVVAKRRQQPAAAQTAQTAQTAQPEHGEQTGLQALRGSIDALQHAISTDPATAEQAGREALQASLQTITEASRNAWEDLADLLWKFDAHIQDGLTAAAETQAVAYQLGRGLSETYWALDHDQETGSTGWSFLLGEERCAELSRLVGRLGAYMGPYTASSIAGTIEIWKSVAQTPDWRGDTQQAQEALFRQIRRWYELIVLGQDPTTLIKPYQLMTNHRTVIRAFRLFWPQLVATVIGLGMLGALLGLLSSHTNVAWAQTLTGVLAAVGLSFAGLTGRLKSSAQAMLTRLRQDSYTDLITLAVETAPPPKNKSQLQQAINQRKLTPVTPN
jgi:hypothetical protein